MLGRPASEEAVSVSERLEKFIVGQLVDAYKHGVISMQSMMAYVNIVTGAQMLFHYIVTSSPFAEPLARVGLGDSEAATSGFLYMVCTLFWDYSHAFKADGGLGERIGRDF